MTAVPQRAALAALIADRLRADQARLTAAWRGSGTIRHAAIDGLLPAELAARIHASFPSEDRLMLKSSIRERKYVGVQMDSFDPLVEEITFAFQQPQVLALVSEITGIAGLIPDDRLYAGGISSMVRGHYLHPHVDNSHDADRAHWRVLNLLYYVTPDRRSVDGGNLELWPAGMGGERVTVDSDFNRLVIMETHGRSLHSVSPLTGDAARRCVSNYYFAAAPVRADDAFHVTSFRGRPGAGARDAVLRADALLRMGIRRVRAGGLKQTQHIYRKPGDPS